MMRLSLSYRWWLGSQCRLQTLIIIQRNGRELTNDSFIDPRQHFPWSRFYHNLNRFGSKALDGLNPTHWFGQLLFLTGLRQDVFLQNELFCESLSLDEESCNQCDICLDVCLIGRDLPRDLMEMDKTCIQCLYCFSVCPEHAIKFKGELGFFQNN